MAKRTDRLDLRIDPGLGRRIRMAADQWGRSIQEETIWRLDWSFHAEVEQLVRKLAGSGGVQSFSVPEDSGEERILSAPPMKDFAAHPGARKRAG